MARKRCFWVACLAVGVLTRAALAARAGEDGTAAPPPFPSASPSLHDCSDSGGPAFEPEAGEAAAFSDVAADAPYREAVGYLADRGI